MTYFDEIRVKVSIANHKVKRNIADLLIKLACRFDQEVVKSAIVGLKTAVSIQKYVPNDNQWHHFAMTLDCWILRNKKERKRKVKKHIFVDGKQVKLK